jgi:predicted outer membrane repeat protein
MKTEYLIISFIIFSAILSATVINVPDDQPTIQAGINVSVDGDTVLVADGTYYENIDFIGKAITVASNYLIDADTLHISNTIINGSQPIDPDFGSVVTFVSNEDSTSVLTGFTITEGSGTNNTTWDASYGGGIYCNNSSPSLMDVTITGNSAVVIGGGIYCIHSNPILTNVTISDNSAAHGGGISCQYSSPSLENVTISGNSVFDDTPWLRFANGSGGGIYCYSSSPILTNVTISDNTANGYAGGVYCYNNSSPNLDNVTITGNSAAEQGGGIYCGYNSDPSLENVIITGNTAAYGGGIYCRTSSNPSLENVTITGNSAAEQGGGIYCRNFPPSFSVDNRCSIYSNTIGNTRGYGTDIYAEECEMIDVIVDTFTVMTPTDFYASPIDNFTFDILHSVVDSLINADVYVSVDGDNSNSGTSPDYPFKTIKHALSRIYFDSLNIHTIHLAPGVYSNLTNGEIFPIYWSNYVNLSGNSEAETILDANSSSGVMNFNGITDAIISNITITNGLANSGGGIYCSNSSPSLVEITIIDNSVISVYENQGSGGGFYCSNSTPNLENVTISNNSSDYSGGGVYCNNSSPILENVTISGNSAELGGGISWSNSNPSLLNVTIMGNSASDHGGGMYFRSNSSLSFNNVTISGNSSDSGGGMYFRSNSSPILQNLTITGNSANYGGGIYCIQSSPDIQNVTISGNSANIHGGGIYCGSYSSPSFSVDNRCSIYSNTIGNARGFGADIFAYNCNTVNIIVDTFTVMTPTDYYASPINDFTFDILHSVVDDLINADVYVSVDGDDSNSGTSPDLPFKTIKHALSRVYFDSLNINTILLAPGVYSNSTNGEIFPLYWSSCVNLSGNSEDEIILDADSTSRVIYFNFVTDAIISNITITNGSSTLYGGGIYCRDSSPSLTNVTIAGNNASRGGGIYCDSSSPSLENVTVSGNSADDKGGGIYCWSSSLILENVTIIGNRADYGGGICCINSNPNLTNVTIINNYGSIVGGGIYCGDHSSPSLMDVIISNNSSIEAGGIYCGDHSSPIITNVTIIGNEASTGGGIECVDNSSPILLNVNITDNNAVYQGGGICCYINSNPSLVNTTISGNSADDGGGMYCRFNSSPSLVNVTISGNSTDYGGGIYCRYNSNPILVNCVLWNNVPQEVYFYGNFEPNSITISYSDIQGGEVGIVTNNNGTVNWQEGNTDEDPLFVGTGEYLFSLLEASPCIDAGTPNTDDLNLPPWDIIGNLRIWDGDGNGSAVIDMGAYEYGAPPHTDADEPTIPNSSLLIHNLMNYPNPFNPETTISFSLTTEDTEGAELVIYNVKGQKIKSFECHTEPVEGRHSIIWNGTDESNNSVSSGIYFYRLKTNDKSMIRKMLLIK